MKIKILIAFVIGMALKESKAQTNPIANKEAVVKVGADVRFTVLTPRLIRMEWDSTGKFNDQATFVVVNRLLPVPKFTVKKTSQWHTIQTSDLEIKYKPNSGKFNPANLIITKLGKENSFTWKPGTAQKQNLKGTTRTLDKFDGDTDTRGNKISLEDGILAKDGWHLLDDSQSFLFDNSDWRWVEERKNRGTQDWYFFGYGQDYKLAISDYTAVAGKVPLPPRYAFGYWWSRYWNYSDAELRELVSKFERYNVPLDVLVIDMEWHTVDSLFSKNMDEFGQRKWWTGWTWNKSFFPDPPKFIDWTNRKNLKTTLNLHPASGVAPFEEQYEEFARKMNFDTSTKRNVPYQGSNKKFMSTLFDVVLRPMEKQGIDFWWLDWQQWNEDKDIKGLSNTWWLNYVFFTDMERNTNKRPMLYHRWGGLGNHRYQIGFSGDAIISWKSLAYQPYFTNTASNVLYGYWSHDLGGHMFRAGQKLELDPELYTRWLQYGVLSPIFRTHSAKDAVLNKEPWNFNGEYLDAQLNAINLRYTLAPYIYTMARKTYDTGLSLCRPMYYDYPKHKEAYEFGTQYQFGDDILVAPITAPMVNGFSKVKIWFPPGIDWYEWSSGTLIKGGQIQEREFTLDEYPIYSKAGAIIPMYNEKVKNLTDNPEEIKIGIFPGASYKAKIYEDNGDDQQYDREYAFTTVETTVSNHKTEILIHPRQGSYAGMKETRKYSAVLYGSHVPEKVLLNNREITLDVAGTAGSWRYDGSKLGLEIFLPETNGKEQQKVEILYKDEPLNINEGMVGRFSRLSKAVTGLKYRKRLFVMPKVLGSAEGTKLMLSYYPEKFYQFIKEFNNSYQEIPEAVKALGLEKETEDWFLNYIK